MGINKRGGEGEGGRIGVEYGREGRGMELVGGEKRRYGHVPSAF